MNTIREKKVINRPVFILFEGMDGCGKSCISKMVADRLDDACWISTPAGYFSHLRKMIDKQFKNNGLAIQLFYMLSNIDASSRARTELDSGFSVIMDRYVPSTLAYDNIARCSGFPDDFWITNFLDQIVIPDVTIFLETSHKIRKNRINHREHKGNTDDASIERQDTLRKRYDHILSLIGSKSKPAWKVMYISNDRTKEECVEECMDIIISL